MPMLRTSALIKHASQLFGREMLAALSIPARHAEFRQISCCKMQSARGLATASHSWRQSKVDHSHADLMGLDLSMGSTGHPRQETARNAPSGEVIGTVAFIPVLKVPGSEPLVLVLSKKPLDTMTGYITIEPFSGDVCSGETLFNAARRHLLSGTGLSASRALDDSTHSIYKKPFSSPVEQRFVAVEVDTQDTKNQGVHEGDIYAAQGDAVVVIRAPLSGFGRALDQLANDGRLVDQRLHVFAVGAELAFAATGQRTGMLSRGVDGIATGLGVVWLVASLLIGGAFIGNGMGYSFDLRTTRRLSGDHAQH